MEPRRNINRTHQTEHLFNIDTVYETDPKTEYRWLCSVYGSVYVPNWPHWKQDHQSLELSGGFSKWPIHVAVLMQLNWKKSKVRGATHSPGGQSYCCIKPQRFLMCQFSPSLCWILLHGLDQCGLYKISVEWITLPLNEPQTTSAFRGSFGPITQSENINSCWSHQKPI